MASTINASTSSGIVQTADTSGVLQLQTAGTTGMAINASQQVSFTNNISAPNTFGFKNRIINGGMVIDQRNAGANVTIPAASYVFSVDRWKAYGTSASKFTIQQNANSVTPPSGFTNYIGVTSSAATTPASTDQYFFGQLIEGYNISDIGMGTANAKSLTVSFWAYSSLTGTFTGALQTNTGSCPFSYTISSANTWTYFTIATNPNTGYSPSSTTNGGGLGVLFDLGSGSSIMGGVSGTWGNPYNGVSGAVKVVGTSGATFYITGVQLEVGTQATSFDFRDYGRELILCQRYYQQNTVPTSGLYGSNMGQIYASTNVQSTLQLPTSMRATPSASIIGTLNWTGGSAGNTTVNLSSFGTIYYTAPATVIGFIGTVASSQTGGYNWAMGSSAGGGYSLSAEL